MSLFHLCFTVSCLHHTLVVSSSGGAAKDWPSSVGRYKKIVGKLHNKQPVWKKETGDTYICYSTVLEYWVVDSDPNVKGFFLHSPDVSISEKTIPRSGWKYWDGKKWATDDKSLTISGGY